MAGLISFSLLSATMALNAQVTLESNTITSPAQFVGCDVNSTVELQIRHDGNFPIDWYTDAIQRMRLNQTGISTINTFPVPNSGFLGISARPAFFTGTPGPFSRLHLVDSIGANNPIIYAQLGSFRPWQRNGVTFTGNADHGYVGQKYNALDRTDMVVHWGNDPGPTQFAPDYLRFIFTGGYDCTRQTGARSLEGAEGMRLYPVNDSSIFVGVGDFFKASVDNGFAVRPNERLDVLDGRVRIRQLPSDTTAVDSFYVMVVDRTLGEERGVVKWIDPNDLPGGDDCDWVVQDSTAGYHVSTVYPNGNCLWDERFGVGVGVQVPKAKLHVYHNTLGALAPVAVYGASYFDVDDGGQINGVIGIASGQDPTGPMLTMCAFGVSGRAHVGRSAVGVFGMADHTGVSSGTATETFGLMGIGAANGNSDLCVGVWANAYGATDPNDNWAAWFEGSTFANGGTYQGSDAILKENVQPLEGAMERIISLQPKTYN
jgi:hypothetical protein